MTTILLLITIALLCVALFFMNMTIKSLQRLRKAKNEYTIVSLSYIRLVINQMNVANDAETIDLGIVNKLEAIHKSMVEILD